MSKDLLWLKGNDARPKLGFTQKRSSGKYMHKEKRSISPPFFISLKESRTFKANIMTMLYEVTANTHVSYAKQSQKEWERKWNFMLKGLYIIHEVV